jgi:flagellar assembly protein FliH
MKAHARKFLFDTDFAGGERQTISMAEHERRRSDAESVAYRNGFSAGEAQAKAEAEERIVAALRLIGEAMERMSRGLDGVEARLETEAVAVAVAVARKLAPALIAREPFAEIAALTTECFHHLVSAPHIAVRIGDASFEKAKAKLEEIAGGRGFEGRLSVLADAAIGPGDCRIEWADGGVNRDRAACEAAITDAVERYVAARAAQI